MSVFTVSLQGESLKQFLPRNTAMLARSWES